MNNQQFRRLLLSDNGRQGGGDKEKPAAAAATSPKAVLGARKHSSIPMTPRQAGRGSVQADFARQLAERNAKANKTKGVAPRTTAPKGTKLAAGYVDRTKLRVDDEDSEMAKRIKNLEESMKAGQIDRDTFERTVQDITGGHLSTTHLVRGLDRKLLERVRRGEDVTKEGADDQTIEDAQEGVEDAFDELASEEVEAIVHDKEEKKGQKITSAPPVVAGVKRTRNDILKDLRRQRDEAIAAAAEHEKKYPSLGPGFRKVGGQGETSRIETDDKGREVLIITGPDGKEKRKVRKQKPQQIPETEVRHGTDDISTSTNLHNLQPTTQSDSSDDDIFEGVGSNYNPLAHLDNAEDDSDGSDEDAQSTHLKDGATSTAQISTREVTQQDPENKKVEDNAFAAPAKRDYFKSVAHIPVEAGARISSADATVRAALTKVRNLDGESNLLQNLSSNLPGHGETDEDRLKRRAAELAASDRDMEDMDLGFGASRFDDADDMEREGEKVKFSQWKGVGANDVDDDDGATRDSKKQRKRGPKKKRGDKNKAEDVLRVMETQREKRTLG